MPIAVLILEEQLYFPGNHSVRPTVWRALFTDDRESHVIRMNNVIARVLPRTQLPTDTCHALNCNTRASS
jgi:hypothetical protein